MKIEKRGNSYRVQKMFNGKRYSASFDHKPSEKEIFKAFADVEEPTHYSRLTFEKAARKYTELKSHVLSPSTIRDYDKMPGRFSKEFRNKELGKITQEDIQKEINRLAVDKSPKTIRNYHAFVSSVFGQYRPDMVIRTTLPHSVKKIPYIPDDDVAKQLIEYSKIQLEGKYYVAIVLACMSLRRSEICAITSDDIDGNILTIDKAKLQNKDGDWVIVHSNKTRASTRQITIPESIAELIKEKGCAYDGFPNDISDFIKAFCKKKGINHFSLHKLRHYFASKLLSENVDIQTVMALGGWETPDVLQDRYAHAFDNKKKVANDIITKAVM